MYRALQAFGRRLSNAAGTASMLQGIGDVEAMWEDEHREWLRQMIEVDA